MFLVDVKEVYKLAQKSRESLGQKGGLVLHDR